VVVLAATAVQVIMAREVPVALPQPIKTCVVCNNIIALFQRAQAHAGVIASYELQQKNKKKMARRALVLAGGGVRGVFTLCVLNHMRQSNTHKKIDIVVGTSAGAFIGALLCFQHVSNVQALWQRTKKSPQMAADIIASAFSDRTQFGPLLAPMYTGRAKRHTVFIIFGKPK